MLKVVGEERIVRSGSMGIFMFLLMISATPMGVKGSPEISVVNVEPERYGPDAEIRNEELFLLTNITRIEIQCKASFPIQWDFSGDTSPLQLKIQFYRESGHKLRDPTFIAKLIVYRVSAAITGSYYCRSILNPTKMSQVHIFAQEKGYRGPDPVLLKYGQTIDVVADQNDTVKLPCASWNPRESIQLYKKSERSGKYEILQPLSAYNYDPKIGFLLKMFELMEPWGKYMCSPSLDNTFDRVHVNLLRKPDFQVHPKTKVVEVVSGNQVEFRCESLTEVEMYVDGELEREDGRIRIEKHFYANSPYPHVATLTYTNLQPEDASSIKCVRGDPLSNPPQVIHEWSYNVVDEFDVSRRGMNKFFSRRMGKEFFACWARTSRSPDISFVHCTNPMECQIRSECQRNGNKCDSALVQLCSGGCALASIENQTGILQCQGDGVFQEVRQFIGVSGAYVYNSMNDAPKNEQLSLTGNHVFKANLQESFTCTGSSFLYSGGFRWGLKSEGNALTILEPNSEEVIRLEESFHPSSGHVIAKALLQLSSTKVTQVLCFAPAWNTTDWDSRSHRVFIRE